ncbi:radial spoke head 14 homolog isoform X2 [Dysidea avara]|uniref:radial spoke head 14 homolog isoform X2 n=1 Tax=Dysidea avara TaxID=196820 RepID=UPI00331FD066
MALPRVTTRPPPHVDPTQARLAYGARAFPKLNEELQSSELLCRQKALAALNQVLHKREHIATALREGIAVSLKSLLKDDDEYVRCQSAQALTTLASHSLGRDAFLQYGIISELAKLFSDKVEEVRYSVHCAIEMCARIKSGAEAVKELVPALVEKLDTEEDGNMKLVLLDSIHWCSVVDPSPALNCGAMRVLVDLLGHNNCDIRGKAARNIMDLSFPLEGKQQAYYSVSTLVGLLEDADKFVHSQSAGALMSITVTTEGKKCLLDNGAKQKLCPLLYDNNSEVKLNTIKTLTMIAEVPTAREELKTEALLKLENMSQGDASSHVRQVALKACQVIKWKP